jgi:hypothetical protein
MDDSGRGLPYVNISAPGDAGVNNLPELGWTTIRDYNVGSTIPGALAIVAEFTNWNEFVIVQVGGLVDSSGNVLDFTNKIIRFHVLILGDGLTVPNNAGGGFVFFKTGSSYVFGQGVWSSIVGTGSWTALSINTRAPDQVSAGWDPSAPKILGIQISTSGGGGSAAAPNIYGPPRKVTILIDYITVSCAP